MKKFRYKGIAFGIASNNGKVTLVDAEEKEVFTASTYEEYTSLLINHFNSVLAKPKIGKYQKIFKSCADHTKNYSNIKCIYHDDSNPDRKVAVASDGHILVYDKSMFDPNLAGKAVAVVDKYYANAKKGEIIPDAHYPKWRNVVPHSDYCDTVPFDFKKSFEDICELENGARTLWEQERKEKKTKQTFADWLTELYTSVYVVETELEGKQRTFFADIFYWKKICEIALIKGCTELSFCNRTFTLVKIEFPDDEGGAILIGCNGEPGETLEALSRLRHDAKIDHDMIIPCPCC